VRHILSDINLWPRMVKLFVGHLEEQRTKMLALAGGLHRQLGTGSVVSMLDDNVLKVICEEVERWCDVPPVEEEEEEEFI
jgi:hypothetical protein